MATLLFRLLHIACVVGGNVNGLGAGHATGVAKQENAMEWLYVTAFAYPHLER